MSTYRAVVVDDLYVSVYIDDIEVDRPGPWNNTDGADAWAKSVVLLLEEGNILYPKHQVVQSTEI